MFTAPPVVAVPWAGALRAVVTSEAAVTHTFTINAPAVVLAVIRTRPLRAVRAGESRITHTLSVDAAPPVVAISRTRFI